MADLFDFMRGPSAQVLADEGMKRAVDHADAVVGGWSDKAYLMLCQYAADHAEFMTEDVRVWAHRAGLPLPPDPRAWGAVTQRARRANIIAVDHYRKTRIPPAHATPRPVWRSLLERAA